MDQYARFLHGIKSEQARFNDYVRNYYEPQIIAAKDKGKNEVVLEYNPKELVTLSDNIDTVQKALKIRRMWQQYGINSVAIRDGKLEVKFANSSDGDPTNTSPPRLDLN